MKDAARLAVETGCWGASTGLEYTPGSFATEQELIEIMSALPVNRRLYASHMRNEANRVLEALREAIRDCAGIELTAAGVSSEGAEQSQLAEAEVALRMLDDALASGLDVHVDRYPYVAFNTGLTNLFPLWSREGGRRST